MVVEALVLLALCGGGASLLWCLGLRGWGLTPLGFVAGCALYLLVGLLLLMSPLPAEPLLALVAVVAGPGCWWAWRARRDRPRLPWRLWASTAAVCVAVAVIPRSLSLYNWHPDSIEYINGAALLDNGAFESAASPYLLIKRLFGIPWMQALGSLNGEMFVHAVLPALALATLGVLAWLVTQGRPEAVVPPVAWVAALGSAALLGTSNRFVFHAFYINGHLLLGALLLVAVGSCWLLATQHRLPRGPLLTLAGLTLAAIPMIRPEAPLLALVAITPFLAFSAVPWRERALVAAGLGAGVLGWNAWVALTLLDRGFSPVGVAVQLVVLAPLPIILLLPHLTRIGAWAPRLLLAAEWLAWPAVLLLLLYDADVVRRSIGAFLDNAYGGAAYWGISLWIYTALVVVLTVTLRLRTAGVLRFYVTTFIPLALALAIGRGGAYRSGPYDSLARMLMQWLPVVALYTAVLIAYGEPRKWVRRISSTLLR